MTHTPSPSAVKFAANVEEDPDDRWRRYPSGILI